ncbi:hypothetical protein AAW51_4073 [Caldimonas brevitalea]|uniref:Uncharacterized protein n=2 Tax=Caldimonas brevitalea TaxID=413882 RepID=A0A0G3BMW2_9BURK|nr:hypothetical protein AAW51_4073 [Caldimonas brevitalea]
MVLGAKKDMGTNVLIKDEAFGQTVKQSNTRPDPAVSEAAKATLQKHYAQDADDEDIKRPRLSNNKQELQAKYQEMALRQTGSVADKSSKHVIADALKQEGPNFASAAAAMPSSALSAHLQQKMTPVQFAAAQHALPKLEAMTPAERQGYLEKGAAEAGQPKYSSKTILPHNENLIQPRKEDVLGVLVSPAKPDAALELQRQYAAAQGGKQLPFMTYDNKTGQVQPVSEQDVMRMAGNT